MSPPKSQQRARVRPQSGPQPTCPSHSSPSSTTPLPQVWMYWHAASQIEVPGGSHSSPWKNSTVPSPHHLRHSALQVNEFGGSQSSPGSTLPLPHRFSLSVQPSSGEQAS